MRRWAKPETATARLYMFGVESCLSATKGAPMKAIRYTDYQTFPVLVDVDKPVAGPGEVVLKVAASGACH